MNIQNNIRAKATELNRKAEALTNLNIHWEDPIIIKCAELHSKSDLAEMLNKFDNHTYLPGIYYFEIVSNHTGKEIVAALSTYKQKKLRSCPKIDKGRDMNTKFLYCGSRKEGLHGRFIQHLGFGSKNTFALQLGHWAKDMQLELKFHYTWLDKNYKEFTELVESALSDKIKPLVGKLA